MRANHFEPKPEPLVSRYRGLPDSPTQAEVEELYTEGCAELLRLEARLLRLKRRLIAAEADSPHDRVAARDAARLQRLRDQVTEELASVRAIVRLLRTALDWAALSPSLIGPGSRPPAGGRGSAGGAQ
jgi:hypothetical protein